MAIYTPRGLKIRLGTAYAFALMARLFPRVDALIAGIVAFAMQLNPLMVAVVAGGISFAFKMAHLFGLFIPPF